MTLKNTISAAYSFPDPCGKQSQGWGVVVVRKALLVIYCAFFIWYGCNPSAIQRLDWIILLTIAHILQHNMGRSSLYCKWIADRLVAWDIFFVFGAYIICILPIVQYLYLAILLDTLVLFCFAILLCILPGDENRQCTYFFFCENIFFNIFIY